MSRYYVVDVLSDLAEALLPKLQEQIRSEQLLGIGKQLEVLLNVYVVGSPFKGPKGQLDDSSSGRRLKQIAVEIQEQISEMVREQHLLAANQRLQLSFQVNDVGLISVSVNTSTRRKGPVSVELSAEDWQRIEALPWGRTPKFQKAFDSLKECKQSPCKGVYCQSEANRMFSEFGLPYRVMVVTGTLAKKFGIIRRTYKETRLFRVE